MADAPNTFGQYKDYTNICGTAFQPFVAQQIEKRKELVLKEPRSNETLQWLTNKTAWIRVSSGVDVDQDNKNFPGLEGDLLSKKYILQAGLTDLTKSTTDYSLRNGIGPDGAYGIGGNDFGLRPMPGITNLSIKTGGKLGTLREANIDFVCYNKNQLDIMDALYMKLGMSVLVEWGHIPYIDNTGKLETNPLPMDFYNIATKEALMEEIQIRRVMHSGNYDAMWGTIKNWSFSLEENGIFKCRLSLVGAGDVLESLKINQVSTSTSTLESIYPVVKEANRSYLNNALYYIFASLQGLLTSKPGMEHSNAALVKHYYESLEQYYSILDISFNTTSPQISFSTTSDLVKAGFNFSTISKLNSISGNQVFRGTNQNQNGTIPEIDPTKFFAGLTLAYDINGVKATVNPSSENQQGLPQAYITLGNLLLLIMATGNIFDKNGSTKNPYIYIDVNTETNRCYTFPGHCSLDPTVCLIGSERLPFNIVSKELFDDVLKVDFPFFDSQNPTMGRFMYTLVNINHVVNIMSNLFSSNPKGDIYFVDLLQELLTSISKACGGYNEFRVVPDDDTRCVRIFDDRRLINPLSDEDNDPYTIIPVLGKGSLAYNFNYTSKISPNTAAMIVISSQAEPTGINISNEALAFSKLREGLTNRLAASRVDSTDTSTSTETLEQRTQRLETEATQAEAAKNELIELIKGIYGGLGTTTTAASARETQQINSSLQAAGVNDEQHNADGTVTFSGPKI
jgi:hypothetical protein